MREKSIDPANFVELHKLLGLALWHIQAFEDTLAKFIALILKMPESRAESEAMAVLRSLESQTLGGLIRELRKGNSTNSVTEFERRIDAFLSERNWLVHRSWREHHTDLFNPQRLAPLFQRLTSLADEAYSLQDYFRLLVRGWVLAQGFTPEKLEAAHRDELKARGVIE